MNIGSLGVLLSQKIFDSFVGPQGTNLRVIDIFSSRHALSQVALMQPMAHELLIGGQLQR